MIVIKDILEVAYKQAVMMFENTYLNATRMLINVKIMLNPEITFIFTLVLIFSGRSSSGSCPTRGVSPGKPGEPDPPRCTNKANLRSGNPVYEYNIRIESSESMSVIPDVNNNWTWE